MNQGFTLVLPTYKESANIAELLTRIYKMCEIRNYDPEILIIEDNSDDTSQLESRVFNTRKNDNTKLIIRYEGKGLGTAIMDGIEMASNDKVIVMDTDLQHRPEDIPTLFEVLRKTKRDMVIGCRREDFEMTIWRKTISCIATLLAKGLVKTRDPMSGFFALRRDKVIENRGKILPMGFKIGLEIMTRCEMKTIDVDIDFEERRRGDSKMSIEHILLYLLQLFLLYWFILSKKLISNLTNN